MKGRKSPPSRTGSVIAVCGPDGVGKTTVVEGLAERAPGAVKHIHHRPGILAGPPRSNLANDFTEPHSETAHSFFRSGLKVLYLYLDWILAWLLTIRPFRERGGWVLIQRPWWDMMVDPVRYRLNISPAFLRVLGRLLPAPDLIVLLEAQPDTVAERKGELSETEIERQLVEWRRLISDIGGITVKTDGTVQESISRVAAAVEGSSSRHRHLQLASLQNGRWRFPTKPRAAAISASRIYQPMNLPGLARWAVGRTLAWSGLLRVLPTSALPQELNRIVQSWIPPGGTVAAQRLRGGDRWFAMTFDHRGRPSAALKIGLSEQSRTSLADEAASIDILGSLGKTGLAVPSIRKVLDGVIVLEPIDWKIRRHPLELPLPVARELGDVFRETKTSNGTSTTGTIHGDFAPWNVLWDGSRWVVIDWEDSRPSSLPFYDILHYFVQSHLLMGRPSAQKILEGLEGRGPVGRALRVYATAAGVDIRLASAGFPEYLLESSASLDQSAKGYEVGIAGRRRLLALWRQQTTGSQP